MRLRGKHAIVTGAGSGIGWATTACFLEQGASVSLFDINKANAASLLQSLPDELSAKAAAWQVDVSIQAEVETATAACLDRFGAADILVNSAATQTPAATIDQLDPGDWSSAFAVNVTGAFLVSRAVIPSMQSNGGGSIIHVASQLGSVGMRGFSAYCATKGAILQLGKVMALDHAEDKIRVNCVSPGATLTERLRTRFGSDSASFDALGDGYPLGRLAEANEIASGILYLASDEASFVTGSDLLIDGGYLAQ
jgi:NAD(P)-dependent dehydrogenase (short-subunit alcohol dehydrogenase family)